MYPISYLLGWNRFKQGGWYEPSLNDRIEWMVKLLSIQPGDRAVDIGAGDGRVVLAMAKAGAKVVGIEKDGKLVKRAKRLIKKEGWNTKAIMIEADMWQQQYADFNKVAIYQFRTVMAAMEQKLISELPKGSRVVSNYWQFPHWEISDRMEDVFLYIKS